MRLNSLKPAKGARKARVRVGRGSAVDERHGGLAHRRKEALDVVLRRRERVGDRAPGPRVGMIDAEQPRPQRAIAGRRAGRGGPGPLGAGDRVQPREIGAVVPALLEEPRQVPDVPVTPHRQAAGGEGGGGLVDLARQRIALTMRLRDEARKAPAGRDSQNPRVGARNAASSAPRQAPPAARTQAETAGAMAAAFARLKR